MPDYRDSPATCPACRVPMEQRVLSDATVDTCSNCRGLWVDWFDGDLVAIAKETAPLSFRVATEMPDSTTCPRCTCGLTRETIGQAIVLLRCAECAGCFVPRASFNELLDLEFPRDPDEGPMSRRGGFARLIAAVRRLFGEEHKPS